MEKEQLKIEKKMTKEGPSKNKKRVGKRKTHRNDALRFILRLLSF